MSNYQNNLGSTSALQLNIRTKFLSNTAIEDRKNKFNNYGWNKDIERSQQSISVVNKITAESLQPIRRN